MDVGYEIGAFEFMSQYMQNLYQQIHVYAKNDHARIYQRFYKLK